jgi:hypothetical protein
VELAQGWFRGHGRFVFALIGARRAEELVLILVSG